jgi:succinate dehydrogenase/fumarate reductase flavoprotein subunit
MKRTFQKFPCDVLIIGTGAAGCAAAITAAERKAKVILINKGAFGRSGTTCSGSVVFSAGLEHGDERDSPEFHFLDTIVEGRYLGNQELGKILAEEAPRTIYDITDLKKAAGRCGMGAVMGFKNPKAIAV